MLCYTILYYTILETEGHIMPVGSQCSKVKLSNLITEDSL